MFIKNISLKNFGNVQNQYLDFGKGLTLFSGNNGEGKSTVLKSLALLLFNQTSGKLADYIKWGEEEFEISTEVLHLGKNLKISFDYSTKSSNRVVEDLDTGESYVNTAAISFLDEFFDFNRAKASIISFENEIDLITTSPSERREYLKKIYDLSFKKEIQSIQDDGQEYKEKESILKGEIIALENQTFEKMMLERLPFSEDDYKTFISSLDVSKESILSLERERATLKKSIQEKEELTNKRFILLGKLTEEEEILSSIENKLIKRKEEQINLAFNISNLDEIKEREFNNYKEKLNRIKEELPKFEEELNDLNINDIDEEDIKEIKEVIIEEEKNSHGITLERKTYEKQVEILSLGKCPTCHQNIENFLLEENQKKLEELIFSEETLENEINRLKKQLEDFQGELEKIQTSRNSLRGKIEGLKKEEEEYISKIERIELDYEQEVKLRKQSYNYEKERIAESIKILEENIETKKAYIKEIQIDFEETEKKLNNLKVEDISELNLKIKKAEEAVNNLTEKIKGYETIVTSNNEKKKFNILQEERGEERNKKIVEKNKELEEAQKMVALIDESSKILSREFPSFVISKMISSLSFYINEFLSKVYPHYEIEVVESKNSLRVLYGPEKSDVKLASGFEQQIFSFAWKYALGKIQNYGLLILDEVDSTASEENSEKFYSTLAKMEAYFEQIFIVTHKQGIKDLLANDFKADVFEVERGTYRKVV